VKRVIAEVPDLTYDKLLKAKDDAGMKDSDFGEFFGFLVKHINMRDEMGIQLIRNSRRNMEKLWMQNYAKNSTCDRINLKEVAVMSRDEILTLLEHLDHQQRKSLVYGNPINKLDKVKGPTIIVGGGPSVFEKKHLELLHDKKVSEWCCIIATDKMLIPCLEHGIVPDMVLSVDGNEEKIVKFYDHPLVDTHCDSIKFVLCTTVHPNVRDRIQGEIYWFNGVSDNSELHDSVTRAFNLMTGITAIATGGNCGCAAYMLAGYLECSPIALIGIDMGYSLKMNLEDTEYWDSLLKSSNGDKGLAMKAYKRLKHHTYGNECLSDLVFDSYRDSFESIISICPYETFNCTEGGSLGHAETSPVKSIMLKEFIKKHRRKKK